MIRLPTTQQLTALAHAVVTTGFDAQRDGLADVVDAARRLGIRPVLVDVVADAGAPRPVRERALGRLIVALSAVAESPAPQVTTGAASAA